MRVGKSRSCERRISIGVICLAVLAFTLSALLPGCGGDEVTKDPIGVPVPPTPETMMMFWADAYERKDIDKYASCLTDGYTHSLSLTGGEEDSAVSLTRQDDLAAARKLFEHECVTGIDMSIVITNGPWATEGGLLFRLESDVRIEVGEPGTLGITPVTWAEFKQVVAADGLACEPGVYAVEFTFLDIEIVRDPADEDWWLIVEIREFPMQ
jgi:hypothetical protein